MPTLIPRFAVSVQELRPGIYSLICPICGEEVVAEEVQTVGPCGHSWEWIVGRYQIIGARFPAHQEN